MNPFREMIRDVHHGIGMGLLALLLGVFWAAYLATGHETLHGAFEEQEAKQHQAQEAEMMQEMNMSMMSMDAHQHTHPPGETHTDGEAAAHSHADAGAAAGHSHASHDHDAMHQHSHSGSLATDAMQRLLRGHIHFMGVGLLSILLLILVASTSLAKCWKKVFGWTFGIGALTYPMAWILMGFRTVEMGPEAAEASVLWLFGPAVALLLGSMLALFLVMAVECIGLKDKPWLACFFEQETP